MTLKPHQEMHPDGTPQGRDPRAMLPADLDDCGLTRVSRPDAIRAKCLDCCCSSAAEVRRCGMVDCALWPFRMGTDPWREKKTLSADGLAALAAGRKAARVNAPN